MARLRKTNSIPGSIQTIGQSKASFSSSAMKGNSVSGSMQTIEQSEASFSGPAVFAGEPGEQFSFKLKVAIKDSNYEVCKIKRTGFDSGASTQPFVGNVDRSTGIATVTWSPVNADVKDTPYYGQFTAYIDAISDHCNAHDYLFVLSSWPEKLKLQIPIYVVQGKAVTLNNEQTPVTFKKGGFTVTDQLTTNFKPEFNIAANIHWGKLKTANLTVKANIEFKNELDIDAAGNALLDKIVTILPEREFTKIYMAGDVPIVVKGKFKIEGHITGHAYGNVILRKVIDLRFPDTEFGLRYDQNGWQAVKNFKTEYHFSFDGQGDAGADIKLELIPDMQISFYDAASGELIVEPYLYAETAIHGQLKYKSSNSGSVTNNDYWFKKLVAGAGMDLKLWAGLSILDFNIASYPVGVTINQPDQFKLVTVLPKTPIWGLPTLTVSTLSTPPIPAGVKDSRVILLQGNVTNVPNPFADFFGGKSLNPFNNWEQPRVLQQIKSSYVASSTASISAMPTFGEYQFHYTQLGNYKVRLAGYSEVGKYFRQTVTQSIAITDKNHDGIADQWESMWGITDPNADPDGDGMTNLQEYQGGHFPLVADNPVTGTTGGGTTGGAGVLNDTGITWGGNYPAGNNTTCIGETIAEQDCSKGRDAQAAAGTLTKAGAGQAGFDFSKLDAGGKALPASATHWICVRDNHTHLVWEVKTTDGGIRDASNTYRWGGKTALLTGTFGTRYNDWNTLVDGSNAGSGLCGFTDWRVPSREELRSIVNYDRVNPTIDVTYFPNTSAAFYWSASPFVGDSDYAWGVYFGYGPVITPYRSYTTSVRLVRGGQ